MKVGGGVSIVEETEKDQRNKERDDEEEVKLVGTSGKNAQSK